MTSRILVAGCGYVGTALAEELARDGHEIWGLRRTPTAPREGVTYLSADFSRPETLAGLPSGLDAVVYCAAADGRGEESYRRAYVEGPRNLLSALESQGQAPRRVLFTSSTGVYGQSAGEWVDESSPAEPTSATGAILLQGEGVFLDESPYPGVVLRLSGIYGPGRTRLIRLVRSGEAFRTPNTRFTNRIHRDDCAGALKHLLFLDSPDPLYIGVDNEPVDLADVFDWIAARLGLPPVPSTDQASASRGGGKRCRGDRLRRSGYTMRVPTFREGYAAMLPTPAAP